MVDVKSVCLILALFLGIISGSSAQTTPPQENSSVTVDIPTKPLELAIGIGQIEKLDFDFNTKLTINDEDKLLIDRFPTKRQLLFNGLKPGRTNVIVRDVSGEIRLKYDVFISATGNSSIVAELRDLIGYVEGLEIKIKGGKVVVEGEIVVPEDIGRVSKVLASYPQVLTLVELSPQTQRVIARKMSDELAKNQLKDVSVRVVNKTYWLEGVVGTAEKKKLALIIAKAYLPPKIMNLSTGDSRFATPDKDDIIDFIAVNEKKEPQPAPKMVKVTSQFVELSKSYGRIFAFKWAPLMGADQSQISFGQTASGNITSTSRGTLSATISNLFPKLNAAKTAGYARIIQSAMVIARDQLPATITKTTTIPFALGTGDFTKASSATVGITMNVTSKILDQEKVELATDFTVNVQNGGSAGGPPVTTSNFVKTNLVIKSKESAAIGGIVQNSSKTDFDNTSDDPAPISTTAGAGGGAGGGGGGGSPLFRLFRAKNYITLKSQYVIFLTPEIVESATAGTDEIRRKFRRRE